MAASLLVDARCILGEGIIWDPQRRLLLWTDIESAALWVYGGIAAPTRTWAVPHRLGSFALCDSGRLLLGLAKGLFIAEFDGVADTALAVTILVPVEPELPSTRINDGRTDRNGNFVFGTCNMNDDRAPLGSFYQYSTRHGLRRLPLDSVSIANSICFSLDGGTMYFCDSPKRRIMQCRYDADSAEVSQVRLFAEFGARQGLPDGSVIDAAGCLWNAEWGAGMVRRYTPAGAIDREIVVPAKNPTCVAFGGGSLQDLYITSARQEMTPEELARTPHAGGVYRASVGDVRGQPDSMFLDG